MKTQSANESFNRMIWEQIPQTRLFHCHPYSLESMTQFQISILE